MQREQTPKKIETEEKMKYSQIEMIYEKRKQQEPLFTPQWRSSSRRFVSDPRLLIKADTDKI
jgi:hypothetical protein